MLGIRTPEQTTQHLAALADENRPSSTMVDLTEEDAFTTALAGRIQKSWTRAKTNKTQVEHNMLECLRERKGEYGPDDKAIIKEAGGSDIYIKLATSKVRAGIAHVKSILLPQGNRAHGVEPTKNPSLPAWLNDMILDRILQNPNMVDGEGNPIDPLDQLDMMQTLARRENSAMAKQRARNMDRKITDQLQEGGWEDAMAAFVDDFMTYPAAFLKGPYLSNEPRLKYESTRQGMRPVQTIETIMRFRTINPFDAYPAPGSDSVHKGDFIERLRMSKNELYRMRKMPGYNESAIQDVMRDHRNDRLNNWLWTDTARAHIADHNSTWMNSTTDLDGLHWYGKAQGYELIEWGMSPSLIPDVLDEYEVDAILVGRHVVRVALNMDPLYRRPVHSTCYEKIPGSVFGNSPSMLMRSTQRMVNATARSLQNNLAHSSGFQAVIDYTRVSSETDIFDLHPFKVWMARESDLSGDRKAVDFFQPESNASELISVIDYFKVMADNDTGIPEFLHGGTGANTGADATAKGRAMLLDQSAKLLLSSIMNVDRDVCMKVIRMIYDYNMLNDPDEDIKGDCQIVPKGINARLQQDAARQSHMALLEVTGADPEDRAIIGLDGRAKLLKSMLETFEEIDHDEIIPSDEELERRIQDLQNQPPPPDPAMVKVEATKEIEAMKLELARERMGMEQADKAEDRRAERMMHMQSMRSEQAKSRDDLDVARQNEIVKLRATRMSEREKLQIELLKERMKAENAVRMKVAELKMQLQNPDNKIPEGHEQVTSEDIRAIVESVVAPMLATFQTETVKVIDGITDKVTGEEGAAQVPQVFNITVDSSCTPVKKTVTTSRDSQGNLQATVIPEGSS